MFEQMIEKAICGVERGLIPGGSTGRSSSTRATTPRSGVPLPLWVSRAAQS